VISQSLEQTGKGSQFRVPGKNPAQGCPVIVLEHVQGTGLGLVEIRSLAPFLDPGDHLAQIPAFRVGHTQNWENPTDGRHPERIDTSSQVANAFLPGVDFEPQKFDQEFSVPGFEIIAKGQPGKQELQAVLQ